MTTAAAGAAAAATRVTTATWTATATAIRALCVCATARKGNRDRSRGRGRHRQEVGYLHSNPKTSHNFRQWPADDTESGGTGSARLRGIRNSVLYRRNLLLLLALSFDKVARRRRDERHLISDNLALSLTLTQVERRRS